MKRLEYRLTEQDLLRFNLYHLEHSPVQIAERRRARILVPIVYMAIAGLFFFRGDRITSSLFAAIAVLWFILSPFWIRRRTRKLLCKHIRESSGQSLSDPITIEIRPEGIFSTAHGSEARYDFSTVEKIAEDNGYTYVYLGKAVSFVLPHDRISRADIDQFIAEIEEHRPNLRAQT